MMKAFIMGNVAGLMFAGVLVALAIGTPPKTEAERLAELTRAGNGWATFVEHMRAPIKIWPY